MRSVLIRRFDISDQLTHLFNALFWAVLAATGILIGSASRANVSRRTFRSESILPLDLRLPYC